MSLLDQFFVSYLHPWQDRDWPESVGCRWRMSGFRLLMGRSCLTRHVESRAMSSVIVGSLEREQDH